MISQNNFHCAHLKMKCIFEWSIDDSWRMVIWIWLHTFGSMISVTIHFLPFVFWKRPKNTSFLFDVANIIVANVIHNLLYNIFCCQNSCVIISRVSEYMITTQMWTCIRMLWNAESICPFKVLLVLHMKPCIILHIIQERDKRSGKIKEESHNWKKEIWSWWERWWVETLHQKYMDLTYHTWNIELITKIMTKAAQDSWMVKFLQ